MIRKYLIANFILELDFYSDTELEKRLLPYITNVEKRADLRVNITRTDDNIEVQRESLTRISDISYFYSDNNNDIYFYYDEKLCRTIAKISFSKDYSSADVVLYELRKMHGVPDVTLMYNVVGTVVNYYCMMHSRFVFHSSSICCNGEGIAFSAKSGTGKSTHTSLWLKNYPDAYILNDDTPIIAPSNDGSFNLCGTPWAGTTGINSNSVVPLKAIVFLERAKTNSIENLSPALALKPFFDGVRKPLTNRMFQASLDTVNVLFKTVPIYLLKCNMDNEAAIIAHDFIFNN